MSREKQLFVKEEVIELKRLLANRSVTISNRIRMLFLIKNNEGSNFSKHTLGKMLGVSSSSVQVWRKLYEEGGLSLLMEDKRIGFKPLVKKRFSPINCLNLWKKSDNAANQINDAIVISTCAYNSTNIQSLTGLTPLTLVTRYS
jgi:hypothetical protein